MIMLPIAGGSSWPEVPPSPRCATATTGSGPLAGFVSVIGTSMQVLGVNWYVLKETGSATSMGFAVLLQAAPTLLLSVWGGVLADRLPARPLLIAAQGAHAVLAAGLAAVALTGVGGLPLIFAISLATGAVSAIEGPVMGRWAASLVDRETLGNALALGSLTNSAGRHPRHEPRCRGGGRRRTRPAVRHQRGQLRRRGGGAVRRTPREPCPASRSRTPAGPGTVSAPGSPTCAGSRCCSSRSPCRSCSAAWAATTR